MGRQEAAVEGGVLSRYLCVCTGVVFFFPRVFVGTGFVVVFAPQARGFRQVRGVASRAGHRNEAHLDLMIITDLFLSLAGTSRRRQIIPCYSPMPRHPIATGPQHSPVPQSATPTRSCLRRPRWIYFGSILTTLDCPNCLCLCIQGPN